MTALSHLQSTGNTRNRKKFLFVVPVFQSVYPKPFANFLAMMLVAAQHEHANYEFIPYVPEREILHSAMNTAAGIVIQNNFDGMIVADDDCAAPYNAIPKLLRRYEQGHDIVLGVGFMRRHPYTITLGRYFKEGVSIVKNELTGEIQLRGFEWLNDLAKEKPVDDLLTIDFGGFPVGLITHNALAKIKAPWFGTEIDGGSCTHDVYFGRKAQDANIPIVADLRIPCHHLSESVWITIENRQIAIQASAVIAQQMKETSTHGPAI